MTEGPMMVESLSVAEAPRDPPLGLAALVGALAEWDDLDTFVEEISQSRWAAVDRPAPDLG